MAEDEREVAIGSNLIFSRGFENPVSPEAAEGPPFGIKSEQTFGLLKP